MDQVNHLFIDELWEQIRKAEHGLFLVDGYLVKQRNDDIKKIFIDIKREETANFTVPMQLTMKFIDHSTSSDDEGGTASTAIDLSSTSTSLSSKRKKLDSAIDRLIQKKGRLTDVWCAPEDKENPMGFYFGSDEKGKKNTAAIEEITLRHHRKNQNGKSYKQTALCIPFAIGKSCKNGRKCPKNHRTRQMILDLKGGEALCEKIDKVFEDIYA